MDEIVEEAETAGTATVDTDHGRSVAVIVGFEVYESLNVLSDSDTMAALDEAAADIAAGDLVRFD